MASKTGEGNARAALGAARAAITPALVTTAILSFFLNLLVFVAPLYSIQIFDRVLASRSATTLGMITLMVGVLFLAHAMIDHYRQRVLVRAGVTLDRILTRPGFEAALTASLVERGPQHVQILRDVDSLRDALSGGAIVSLLDAPWTPIFIVVCFLLHPWIGAVASGGALLLVAIAWINETVTRDALLRASLESIRALDRLSASLRSAEAVRALGMAEAVRRHWSAAHGSALAQSVRAGERAGALIAGSKLVRMAVQSGVLGMGAYLAILQEISPGVMFAASIMMGRALAPIEGLVSNWRTFVTARAAHERLAKTFEATPPGPPRTLLPEPRGILEVSDVTIVAPESRLPIVRGARFALEPGTVAAIVGPTGSGKSSLARALVGAWEPARGVIRLDGSDLRHYDLDQLGRAIGYLPQDVSLFAGTVRDNIARFQPDATDEEVTTAAIAAGAHQMIQALRDGYSTAVGEDGVGLSGGQRQRIGLARALFRTPALVVLDEPNANLDGEGDAALEGALIALRRAMRTVIVVSHKPSLLESVDRIIVMHDGAIRVVGSRDEVLPMILPAGGRRAGDRAANERSAPARTLVGVA